MPARSFQCFTMRWRPSVSQKGKLMHHPSNKGLHTGEIVVVRGQYRLTPGTVVTLANPTDPEAVSNPTPASAGLLP
jgi:hypothetical protein